MDEPISADDPDYAAKRLDGLLDRAINTVAMESALPMIVLHRILLKKLHRCMKEVLEMRLEEYEELKRGEDVDDLD